MKNAKSTRVCPVERAGGVDNPLRRWLQNPVKILKPFIESGMTVLDLEKQIRLHQCSPGSTNIQDKVDFVLGFYVIHELPDKEKLFQELITMLKPGSGIDKKSIKMKCFAWFAAVGMNGQSFKKK